MKQVVLFLLLSLPAWAATPTMLVFTWQANPLNASLWPPCGATLNTCISGETIYDITAPAGPVAVASGIAPSVLTYTLTPLPPAGAHSYGLVYNAYDQSGNPVQSSYDQVTVTVPSMVPNHPVDTKAVPSAPGTSKPSVLAKIKKGLHL